MGASESKIEKQRGKSGLDWICLNLGKDVKGCKTYKCIKSLKGLPSNSISPSDTWVVEFLSKCILRPRKN